MSKSLKDQLKMFNLMTINQYFILYKVLIKDHINFILKSSEIKVVN